MNLAALSDDLYVAAQLQAADVAQLADLGVKHLICNRPDNEEMDQLNLAELKPSPPSMAWMWPMCPSP